VYFCGPIAPEGMAARGGYQASNRRTIDALSRAGVKVSTLSYPHPTVQGMTKVLAYVTGFLRLFYNLAACHSGCVVHITALYKHFIYVEWLLVQLARLKRCHVVYDIRAGSMLRYYEECGQIYRRVFASTLRSANLVMVEGEIYFSLVEALTGRLPVYLPNHVQTNEGPARGDARSSDSIPCMIYVGRITRDKGIEIALDAARAFTRAGVSCLMRVVGDGDPAYLSHLREQFAECTVDWRGPLTSDQVTAALSTAHFFLFPTHHPGEGHSNALTEAMAMGCVPIASVNGFNRSVVGDAGAILPMDATGDDYAEAVRAIWVGGKWRDLSTRAAARVRDRFATSQAVSILVREYELLRRVT
jgi:glycosyltransferase involved in cell wall biosynthesis